MILNFQGKEEVYAKFVDRLTNVPDETLFSSVEEGLDFLKKDQTVISIEESNIRGYFKANPFHNLRYLLLSII